MTDKEKIKNIIELFIAWNEETDVIDVANIDSATEFIANSLQEEPVSEGLEEASRRYALNNTPYEDCADEMQEAFKAGARWQLKQMMSKAIDAQCFGFQGDALFSFKLPADNYLVGSKVKVIVIKGD